MPTRISHFLIFILSVLCTQSAFSQAVETSVGQEARMRELDALWAEVSRSVTEGDFEGYAATCHPLGVLVSGVKQSSYPLTKALAGWKQGFVDTKLGKMKASVEFRFSQRIGDETTAHETGIFRYATIDGDGKETAAYIHFVVLLVKTKGKWQVLMEHQKTKATEEEWKKLKSPKPSKTE